VISTNGAEGVDFKLGKANQTLAATEMIRKMTAAVAALGRRRPRLMGLVREWGRGMGGVCKLGVVERLRLLRFAGKVLPAAGEGVKEADLAKEKQKTPPGGDESGFWLRKLSTAAEIVSDNLGFWVCDEN
jgi:hypothetical protein